MSKVRIAQDFESLPKTYRELVAVLPPRPLHHEVDYQNAVEMVDRIAGHDLDKDQEDYLDALSTFVEQYEDEQWPIDTSDIRPIETLRFLLAENGMSGSDLGRLLGNRTLGPAILRGDRDLSKTHIRILAARFRVAPGLFL